jgi:dienelactone hydrolase
VGVQAQYQWSARDLAGHGYVAFTIDPRGAGKSGEDAGDACGPGPPAPSCATTRNNAKRDDYLDALESGIAFALSSAGPYHAIIDPNEIGAAGHSAGADTLSYQQGVEPRLKAIVAWDNLISSTTGDQGNANCSNQPTVLVKPRVPALGEASETCSSLVGPDAKKTGYELWRKHGIPAMEVVFAGTQHTDWAQEDNVPGTAATGTQQQLHDFEYYTRAWFDLYLRHNTAAAATLLASTVNGRPRDQVISSRDHSAAYLPELGVDCEDLRACAMPASLAPASVIVRRRTVVWGSGARLAVLVGCHGNRGARCDGQLELEARGRAGRPLGASQAFRLPAGRGRSVAVELTSRARRLRRHAERLHAVLIVLSGVPPDSEHPRRVAITLVRRTRR